MMSRVDGIPQPYPRSMYEGRSTPAPVEVVRVGLEEAAERRGRAADRMKREPPGSRARARARLMRTEASVDVKAWLIAAYEIRSLGDLTFGEAVRIAHVQRRTAYGMLRDAGVGVGYWSAG